MSIFDFFEDIRRANVDLYTANPLEQMNDDALVKLADETGMTVEELREQMTTPHLEMTCPLCGRPSTHLVGCKGCGSDAWGGELVMAHGDDVHDRLRERYKVALANKIHLVEMRAQLGVEMTDFGEEQIDYATTNAYTWGGCMICVDCWHHTLAHDVYLTCPINILAERMFDDLPVGALMVALNLYRQAVEQAFIDEELPRAEAVAILGQERVEEIEYAKQALAQDIAHGLEL